MQQFSDGTFPSETPDGVAFFLIYFGFPTGRSIWFPIVPVGCVFTLELKQFFSVSFKENFWLVDLQQSCCENATKIIQTTKEMASLLCHQLLEI